MRLDATLAIIGAVAAVGLFLGAARFRQIGGDVQPPPDHVVGERVIADPVFAHLGGPAAAHLADRVEIVTAQPGDIKITEGEPGGGHYLVVDGRLVATIGGEAVGEMSARDSFGESRSSATCLGRRLSPCVTARGGAVHDEPGRLPVDGDRPPAQPSLGDADRRRPGAPLNPQFDRRGQAEPRRAGPDAG